MTAIFVKLYTTPWMIARAKSVAARSWSCLILLTCDSKSFGATIDRTIGRTILRLIVRSVTGGNDRLIVGHLPSVVGSHDWSYIDRWSLPLVARFPTMALAIDILQSFVIARPRVEINRGMRPLLEIVANIADRSHLGPIATNRTIQKSYDPVCLWLKVGLVYSIFDTIERVV